VVSFFAAIAFTPPNTVVWLLGVHLSALCHHVLTQRRVFVLHATTTLTRQGSGRAGKSSVAKLKEKKHSTSHGVTRQSGPARANPARANSRPGKRKHAPADARVCEPTATVRQPAAVTPHFIIMPGAGGALPTVPPTSGDATEAEPPTLESIFEPLGTTEAILGCVGGWVHAFPL
jgi:hypothetical protein